MHCSSLVSDDRGQVALEQLLMLGAVVGIVVVAAYVLKTQARNLTHTEKATANETLNKST